MSFKICFGKRASEELNRLQKLDPNKFRKVQKTVGLLETNPRHHGLQTHKYSSLQGAKGEEVFEAYVENKTPAAYRIFWHYGPEQGTITIIAITPHP